MDNLGGGTDGANWQQEPEGNQRESLLDGSPFIRELGGWGEMLSQGGEGPVQKKLA